MENYKKKVIEFINQNYLKIIVVLTVMFVFVASTLVVRESVQAQSMTELTKDLKFSEKKVEDLLHKVKSLTDSNIILEEKNDKLSKKDVQDKIDGDIKNKKEQLHDLESKHKSLNTEKKELEDELNRLEGDIVKATGAPKNYPAGKLYVGQDVKSGRYRIHNGSSNFVVRDAFGGLEVNIILGGRNGVSEYINTFADGDIIEARSSFTLTPIG